MAAATPIRRLIIAKCVWGDAYAATMLSLNIPSLLSTRNIGSLHGCDVEHRIYTTAHDRERIEAHPTYRFLATQIRSEIVVPELAHVQSSAPYDATIERMNNYHQRIVDDCAAIGAAWLFDQPDHIWGDGSLSHLVELAHNGNDVVFFPGIRSNLSDISAAIDRWRIGPAGIIEIAHRPLVDLALKHMHFHDSTRFWGPLMSTAWPHHIAWRISPGCFLRRCFYPQPFLINTRRRPLISRSVDFSYIDAVAKDNGRVHFISDSDKFFVLEVSDKLSFLDYSWKRMSLGVIGNWAVRHAGAAHRNAFQNSVVYHSEDVPPRRLRRIHRFADMVASSIGVMVDLDEAAASIMEDRPRAANFIRLCLNHNELMRSIVIPQPFRLQLPPEPEIPDHAGFTELLSRGQLGVLTAWIARHILPAGPTTTAESTADTLELLGR